MAAPTANQLINLSLKDAGVIGVGQTPNAEDSNDALTRLNWMLDQWAIERWLVYGLSEFSITSTGATSYTVGPGGDINAPQRPDRLEDAFLRQLSPSPPNQIDYPLEILQSWHDYSKIALKQQQSFPEFIFYDSSNAGSVTLGRIYPWPVPQANLYAVHILIKTLISELPNLAATLNLPPVYFAAVHSNLSVVLRDAYDLPPKPILVARAKVALNALRKANTQIGRLSMPPGLLRDGIYDFFSDRIRGM